MIYDPLNRVILILATAAVVVFIFILSHVQKLEAVKTVKKSETYRTLVVVHR